MSKAKNFVMPLVKNTRPDHGQCQNCSCLTCSKPQLSPVTCLYSLMHNIKSYTKIQSRTIKPPCYQTCNVIFAGVLNFKKSLLDNLT